MKEIEVEGWTRSCGRPCLSKNVPTTNDFYGTLEGTHPTDWRLVQYAPQRAQWHDSYDRLRGTQSYGTAHNTGNAWSVKWDWDSFDEYLFKVGDDWIIIDKIELAGSSGTKWYQNQAIKVIASSEQCDPHEGKIIF